MARARLSMCVSTLALVILGVVAIAKEAPDPHRDGDCPSGDATDERLNHVSLLQTEMLVSKSEPIERSVHAKAVASDLQQSTIEHVEAATTTSYHPPSNRAEAAGVKLNGAGDLNVFLTALVTNIFMVVACVAFFMFVKDKFPKSYSSNLETNAAPLNSIPGGFFGWMSASWAVTTPDVMESIGLDQAMLIEFTNLAMKIMAMIGVPMLCIMGPIHCVFGGHRAGDDHLSYLSFGNVVDGSNLYWIHAFIIWGVVFAVQSSVYKAQEKFLKYRFQWLRELPVVRAQTIMVEGIPEEFRSDEKLKGFFQKMFGSTKVTSGYVVKSAPALEAMCANRDAVSKNLDQARFKCEKAGGSSEARALVESGEKELAALDVEIKKGQAEVKSKSAIVGIDGYNTSSGFVSFASKADTALALSAQYSEDYDKWCVGIPPEPSSILWRDLQQDDSKRAGLTLLGYLLTTTLYMLYMPAVIWITQIAVTIHMGPLQPLWAGFAPTMGLQIMVAFLPTFLILIFRFCFTLKDDAWAQQVLQNWYFVFQVVFVIMITAIGGSMEEFLKTLAESPLQIFALFGKTMPFATHFYMNFLVLQWASHAMVLTRYIPLTKYLIFRKAYDDDTAVQMSEPEDQDYYGMGARSTRMTINACIGIVYGTLSPPINLLTFIEFLICRVIYGYLLPFAETKKPDLGGVFWVQSLRHLFVGNIIYCIVMVGVLLGRATTNGPAIIAAPALFYVVWSMQRFERAFLWEKLPMTELMDQSAPVKSKKDGGQYIQPMLMSYE